MFRGLIIKESLADTSILSRLSIEKEESWDIDNAVNGQAKHWHVVHVQLGEDHVGEVAEDLSQSLKNGPWYVDLSDGKSVYVVFPRRVFLYEKGNTEERKRAEDFGRAIGIPESQLDWKE